jgi:hypothetical protein
VLQSLTVVYLSETLQIALAKYPLSDHVILSEDRGFVSKIVGEQGQKYLRCPARERRRFLQETDHNHLLARIPDVAGNCACRWSPISDSESMSIEIDDSDDD